MKGSDVSSSQMLPRLRPQIVFGLMGAWSFKLLTFPAWPVPAPRGEPLPGADSVLNLMLGEGETPLIHFFAYFFPIVTILPGIPVLMVMTRYNLLSGGLASKKTAMMVGVILPWVVTTFLYQRPVLVTLCNWIALVVQGYTNFVLPVAMYRKAVLRYPYEHEVLLDRLHRKHRRQRRRRWRKLRQEARRWLRRAFGYGARGNLFLSSEPLSFS